ncbi:hypothetical protein BJ508DRAFT_410854 [Ascobolus immersus RN42]|uniref:Uncharacterized protein n=1 Tax=Ascobolus immersus RN42 TaxID=1160509 RepID=A0A3N4IMJ3_ASCIM|nr:hypothetical protein BJ508DRAFT_410854 [Ascobolus immersus RN42]
MQYNFDGEYIYPPDFENPYTYFLATQYSDLFEAYSSPVELAASGDTPLSYSDLSEGYSGLVELAASGDTPLSEVVCSGMEPAFYIHIERLTYKEDNQHLSRTTPASFLMGENKLDMWFAGSACEDYRPWSEPPSTALVTLNRSVCAATILGDRVAILRADPREDQITEIWGCVGFSLDSEQHRPVIPGQAESEFASKINWKICQTFPSLFSPDQEPIICRDIPCPPFARWVYLFQDSNLFKDVPVTISSPPDEAYLRRLVGERPMLWAMGALYYVSDGNLNNALPHMFSDKRPDISNPLFYARQYPRPSYIRNDVLVATVYQRTDIVVHPKVTLI